MRIFFIFIESLNLVYLLFGTNFIPGTCAISRIIKTIYGAKNFKQLKFKVCNISTTVNLRQKFDCPWTFFLLQQLKFKFFFLGALIIYGLDHFTSLLIKFCQTITWEWKYIWVTSNIRIFWFSSDRNTTQISEL